MNLVELYNKDKLFYYIWDEIRYRKNNHDMIAYFTVVNVSMRKAIEQIIKGHDEIVDKYSEEVYQALLTTTPTVGNATQIKALNIVI
jgi:hypothetical protein